MKWLLITAIVLLCSCNSDKNQTSSDAASPLSCKGTYTVRDSNGDLQKYNQYWQSDQKTCLTDKIALTIFESSSELRRKHNAACTPQPTFVTIALKASGNYYTYRNDRMYLDFDSSNGTFRRLTLGEDQKGNVVYQRDISCFYTREDHETEPINPQDFGKQLLLDFSNFPASSADFAPNEIFKYTNDSNGNWFFTRYDDVESWDFTFCPERTVPFENCIALRNGHLYFYPVTDAVTQASLLAEAKLIRTQFNFSEINKSEFQSLWDSLDKNGKELQQGGDWKFYTNHVVDASKFFDYSWRRYVMRLDPTMPDVNGVSQFSPICYSGSQYVTLSGGAKAKVYGEICYSNGTYSFTAY